MLNLVQTFARQQQRGVGLAHDKLDLALQADLLPESSLPAYQRRLEELATAPALLRDLGAIKQQFKILFEACIWVGMYNPSKHARGTLPGGWTPQLKTMSVDAKLREYWLDRFPHPGYWPTDEARGDSSKIVAWHRSFRQHTRDWINNAKGIRDNNVVRYMSLIEAELVGLGQAGRDVLGIERLNPS